MSDNRYKSTQISSLLNIETCSILQKNKGFDYENAVYFGWRFPCVLYTWLSIHNMLLWTKHEYDSLVSDKPVDKPFDRFL